MTANKYAPTTEHRYVHMARHAYTCGTCRGAPPQSNNPQSVPLNERNETERRSDVPTDATCAALVHDTVV